VYNPVQELQAQINGRKRELCLPAAKISMYKVETERKKKYSLIAQAHFCIFA